MGIWGPRLLAARRIILKNYSEGAGYIVPRSSRPPLVVVVVAVVSRGTTTATTTIMTAKVVALQGADDGGSGAAGYILDYYTDCYWRVLPANLWISSVALVVV